jgi:hypothetical protein
LLLSFCAPQKLNSIFSNVFAPPLKISFVDGYAALFAEKLCFSGSPPTPLAAPPPETTLLVLCNVKPCPPQRFWSVAHLSLKWRGTILTTPGYSLNSSGVQMLEKPKGSPYHANFPCAFLATLGILVLALTVFKGTALGQTSAQFEIVANELGGPRTGEITRRHIFIYWEESSFDLERVIQEIRDLSDEYATPKNLRIAVYSDREMLERLRKFEANPIGIQFRQDEAGRKAELEYYSRVYPSQQGYFRVDYARNANFEFLDHNPDKDSPRTERINLKNVSSRSSSDGKSLDSRAASASRRGNVSTAAITSKLANLAESPFASNQSEIRIWIAFNSFHRRGLVIEDRNQQQIKYFPGTLDGSGRPSVRSLAPLSADVSEDWNARTLIEEEHPRDTRWVDPDGINLVVEVRIGEGYRVIAYSVDTDTSKGRELIERVRKLEKEYDIRLLP